MKNLYTFTLFSILAFNLSAQTQIENGGFEFWDNLGQDTEEPQQWSSLKTATDDNNFLNLANQAPQVVWRETSGVHSGSFCLKLVVASYNVLAGLSPNGILTNGRVFSSTTPSDAYVYSDLSSSHWNTPCTDRPDSLIGWYKYSPQGGDKGKVEVLFHNNSTQGQLPSNGSTSHWVGNGLVEFTSSQSIWKRFSFPINWLTNGIPNYVLIVSTAGDETNSVTGSTLWLDDLAFVYNPTPSIVNEAGIFYSLYNYNQQIHLNLPSSYTSASLSIYNLTGQKVFVSNKLNTSIFHELNNGIYIYQLIIDGKTYSGKISID
jgi:hypothetical protein